MACGGVCDGGYGCEVALLGNRVMEMGRMGGEVWWRGHGKKEYLCGRFLVIGDDVRPAE